MPTFTWVEDRNPSTTVTPKVIEAQFDDGYSQRISNSINPLQQEWSLTFNNRSNDTINAIIAFLEQQKGVIAFDWSPAYDSNTYKVIAGSWNIVTTSHVTKSLSVTFKRVYE